jgi:hypothetical protein
MLYDSYKQYDCLYSKESATLLATNLGGIRTKYPQTWILRRPNSTTYWSYGGGAVLPKTKRQDPASPYAEVIAVPDLSKYTKE